MAKETLGTDINGKVDFSLPPPVLCDGTTLAGNVDQTFTTPANYNRVFFSYSPGASVFVCIDGTAAIFGASPAPTTSELNPMARQLNIKGGQTINVISGATAFIGLRYDTGS